MRDIARVVFQVDDVLEHAEGMDHPLTGSQAKRFMDRNRKHIEEAMTRKGWEVIDALLHIDRPWENKYETVITKE